MQIGNRLFPYPILSEDKDDYNSSIFEVKATQSMNGVNNVLFKFEVNMDNKELNELIRHGKAEYVIHIENSSTTFRTTVHSSINNIEYEIPINRLSGKVEMVAFIISKENINGFYSDDWNEDYKGISFNFTKANILGYKNLDGIDILKEHEELTSNSSIFLVYKRLTEESKPMEVDLDSNRIKIGLGCEDYKVYSRFSSKIEFQPILNTMIILPALVYVFEELKQEDGIESYLSNEWFISLELAYKKRGLVLLDEIRHSDKTSIVLAQEAMELPVGKALAKIAENYEGYEEDDV